MRRAHQIISLALTVAAPGCGAVALTSQGATVVAAPQRPFGDCMSLAKISGSAVGTPMFTSADDLVNDALADLRNLAGRLGATHVVTQPPILGTRDGGTSQATVHGEALRCTGPTTSGSSGDDPGCAYDTQCKGTRVCIEHRCSEPNVSGDASTDATTP